VQADTPSCETVKVFPPTLNHPVRAGPVFAAALKVTDPLPLPDVALVIVSQFTLAVAFHAQPLEAVTAIVPVPPPAATDWLAGAMKKLQPAACDTVNVFPAIVSVALRAAPVFALTEKLTVPLPVPFAPSVIEIHDASSVAVHAQPAPAVTVTLPVPPLAAIDWLDGAIE
jgi:hypothetical protein